MLCQYLQTVDSNRTLPTRVIKGRIENIKTTAQIPAATVNAHCLQLTNSFRPVNISQAGGFSREVCEERPWIVFSVPSFSTPKRRFSMVQTF